MENVCFNCFFFKDGKNCDRILSVSQVTVFGIIFMWKCKINNVEKQK